MATAYFIVGWLLLEVSENLVPALRLPDWFHSGVAFLLIIGFPVAMVFAWAFELTTDGLKREHDVERSESITPGTGRKLDFAIIGLLVVALAYFAYDKFLHNQPRDAGQLEVATETLELDKSIAVLPFVNMSSDAEQEYFSDGLAEEVLNLLARIPELRVIARTSSFSYKGKDIKIADLARELKVGHVLEGSVRKAGNQLRITAQLIRASDSSHLWSQTWDRTLEDIFAIQDEIAAEVTNNLKITLLGEVPKVDETDPEAYTLFLQARQLQRLESVEGFAQSTELYRQVLKIDPGYAAAWGGLAGSYNKQTNHGLIPFEEGRALAREAANRALAIDPELTLAHVVLGWTAMLDNGDLVAAARHFGRAMALEPAGVAIISGAANLVARLGRLDDGITLLESMVSRDPVNPGGYFNLGYAYRFAGRLDEAITAFRTALSLSPEFIGTHYRIGEALILKGEPDEALAAFHEESFEGWRLVGLPLAYHALGKAFESDAALAELIEREAQAAAYNIAYVFAFRGESDRAFEWLDKAVQNFDSGLIDIVGEQLFENIHDDPRWLPFLESIGKSPEQLAAIEFEVNLPE